MSRGNAFDLVVVGAGPAGTMAAVETVRRGRRALIVERRRPGGALWHVSWLENVPGIPDGIAGPELAQRMAVHLARFGVPVERDEVRTIAKGALGFAVAGAGGPWIAPTVVVATGCRPTPLGIPGADELTGSRVFHWFDEAPGEAFAGGNWCVVGGGEEAFDQATALAQTAASVRVVLPGSAPTASRRAVEQAERDGVAVTAGYRAARVAATSRGVTLECDGPTGRVAFDVDAVLACLGRTPETALLPKEALDASGLAICDATGRTPLPGLLVAGDVRRGGSGRVATASGDGAATAEAIAAGERA